MVGEPPLHKVGGDHLKRKKKNQFHAFQNLVNPKNVVKIFPQKKTLKFLFPKKIHRVT
jgi:hypothetical protein